MKARPEKSQAKQKEIIAMAAVVQALNDLGFWEQKKALAAALILLDRPSWAKAMIEFVNG